jgi:hypothetical protein
MVEKVRFRSMFAHPVTLVVTGWLMFVVGQVLAEPQWLKVTVLLAARALP